MVVPTLVDDQTQWRWLSEAENGKDKASCFPETQSFPQRPLESSSIFRADILGPAGKLKPEAGQTSKRHTRAEIP